MRKPRRKASGLAADLAAEGAEVVELAVPEVAVVMPDPRQGEVFEPSYVAHRLRLSGMPWPEVAAACGYPTGAVAELAVRAYLQKAVLLMDRERAEEALALELEVLDALKHAWWEAGVKDHDINAATLLLRISAQRGRLLEHFTEDRALHTTRTVVITGDSADYVAGLRKVIGSDAAMDDDGTDPVP